MSEEQKRMLQQQLWAICNLLRGRISGDDYRVSANKSALYP